MSPLFKRKERETEKKESLFKEPEKKKEEVIRRTILVEPFEILIEEREEAGGDPRNIKITRRGFIKVVNLSDSDLHSISIVLSKRLPGIGDKLKIPFLSGKEEWSKELELRGDKPSLKIERDVSTITGKVVPIGKTSNILVKVSAKNNLQLPLENIEVGVKIPKDAAITKHNENVFMFSQAQNLIKLVAKKLKPDQEALFEGEITLSSVKEEVSIAEIHATYEAKGSISGLDVVEARAKSIIDTNVVVDQDPSTSDEWLTAINLNNPNSYAVEMDGEIKIEGDVISTLNGLPEGVSLEKNVLKINGLKIRGIGKIKIGPIKVKSPEMPSVELNISAYVKGRKRIMSKGQLRVQPTKLDTLGVEISKKAEVVVDEAFASLLAQNEIPSITTSKLTVNTKATLMGSRKPNKIIFVEEIPNIATDIESISVTANGRKIGETNITHERVGEDLKVSVEIPGEAKEIELNYSLIVDGAKARQQIYELPARVIAHVNGEEIDFELKPIETPKIKIKKMRANISASHKLEKGEEPHVYKATIIIENKGNAPVLNKTITVELPPNIEIIETTPEATINPRKGGAQIIWKINKVMPGKRIYLQYKVKGSGEYSLDEIKKFKIS